MKKELSKSECSAIAMVQSCLRAIQVAELKTNWFLQMNIMEDRIADGEYQGRHLLFLFLVYPGLRIEANCFLEGFGGEWDSGRIEISLPDSVSARGKIWKFDCRINNGVVEVKEIQ